MGLPEFFFLFFLPTGWCPDNILRTPELFYKVAFPFHFATSTRIKTVLFIVGYACPTIITVITIAVTQPRNIYTREGTCWLNWDQSRALLAFVIPAFIIVGINFIFLMVVMYKICTQGRMAVSTTNDDAAKLQRILRSLIIKMPVLGTTWGIGIFTFAPGAAQNEGLHYTFTILNAFQVSHGTHRALSMHHFYCLHFRGTLFMLRLSFLFFRDY